MPLLENVFATILKLRDIIVKVVMLNDINTQTATNVIAKQKAQQA
jgi:hypothetical protein